MANSGSFNLLKMKKYSKEIKGSMLLCHNASIDKDFNHAVEIVQSIFWPRLKSSLFQHNYRYQDNMIETQDFIHPYFKLPVYSLYSKTRIPTDEMLDGINTLVWIQDVGQDYAYFYTGLLMEGTNKGIKVIVLTAPSQLETSY